MGASMPDAWLCINCGRQTGREYVKIEQSVCMDYGSHGERLVTYAAVACSWECVEQSAAKAKVLGPTP